MTILRRIYSIFYGKNSKNELKEYHNDFDFDLDKYDPVLFTMFIDFVSVEYNNSEFFDDRIIFDWLDEI